MPKPGEKLYQLKCSQCGWFATIEVVLFSLKRDTPKVCSFCGCKIRPGDMRDFSKIAEQQKRKIKEASDRAAAFVLRCLKRLN